MTILVTGSKGFIGKRLVQKLKERYSVGKSIQEYDWKDGELPMPDLDGVKHIFHLGAISSTTENDLNKIFSWNYDFTLKLIHLSTLNKIPMTLASSASVYGEQARGGRNPLKEKSNSDHEPRTFYAWSKWLIDRHLEQMAPFWQEEECPAICSLRLFNVFGEGEDHKIGMNSASPLTNFYKQAKDNKKIIMFEGSDNFYRDWIHVDDVCEYFIRTMEEPYHRGVFNIGSGKTVSFGQIGRAMADKFDAEIEYVAMPQSIRRHYQEWTIADCTKTNSNLGHLYGKIKIADGREDILLSPLEYINLKLT